MWPMTTDVMSSIVCVMGTQFIVQKRWFFSQPPMTTHNWLSSEPPPNKPSVRWKSFAFRKLVWWHFQVGWASALQFVFFWDNVNNQKCVWIILLKMTFWISQCSTDCLHVVQTMPLHPPNYLLPHLNPDWFYLSGTSLPRLSWKRGH